MREQNLLEAVYPRLLRCKLALEPADKYVRLFDLLSVLHLAALQLLDLHRLVFQLRPLEVEFHAQIVVDSPLHVDLHDKETGNGG